MRWKQRKEHEIMWSQRDLYLYAKTAVHCARSSLVYLPAMLCRCSNFSQLGIWFSLLDISQSYQFIQHIGVHIENRNISVKCWGDGSERLTWICITGWKRRIWFVSATRQLRLILRSNKDWRDQTWAFPKDDRKGSDRLKGKSELNTFLLPS